MVLCEMRGDCGGIRDPLVTGAECGGWVCCCGGGGVEEEQRRVVVLGVVVIFTGGGELTISYYNTMMLCRGVGGWLCWF